MSLSQKPKKVSPRLKPANAPANVPEAAPMIRRRASTPKDTWGTRRRIEHLQANIDATGFTTKSD